MTPQTMSRENCPRCRGGRETFRYYRGVYLYDVDKARVITQDGRETVEVEPESVRESVENCTVDDFHVAHVDPRFPGIIACVEYRAEDGELIQAHLLIDGHHRAARCLRDGLPFFAYILSEEESKEILINEQGRRVERPTDNEKSPAAQEILTRFEKRFAASAELFRRSTAVMAGVDPPEHRGMLPFPVHGARGEGAWKWDADGNRLVDFSMAQGALLLGHDFGPVRDAVAAQLALGASHAISYEAEVRWAEAIQTLVPSAERVRFTASASEAVSLALRVARAFTGRPIVLCFEEHDHGWGDEAMVHAYHGPTSGLNASVADHVVRFRQDRPEEILERIAEGDLAAVILEPAGGCAGGLALDPKFLAELREATQTHGTLLVFDETTSGFRHHPGGVQAATQIIPDMTVLGKIVSAGLPGGVVAGRAEIMSVFGIGTARGLRWAHAPHPLPHANALTAAAGAALLKHLRDGVVQERARAAAAKLAEAVNAAAAAREIDLRLETHGTSIFHILIGYERSKSQGRSSLHAMSLYSARSDLYGIFRRALLVEGVDCPILRGYVAAVHGDADVERETLAAFERALEAVRTIPGLRRGR